jgi:hypothetical protein
MFLVPLVIVETSQNIELRSKVLGEIQEVNNSVSVDRQVNNIILPDVGGLKY